MAGSHPSFRPPRQRLPVYMFISIVCAGLGARLSREYLAQGTSFDESFSWLLWKTLNRRSLVCDRSPIASGSEPSRDYLDVVLKLPKLQLLCFIFSTMDTTAFMAEINKIPPVTRFLAGSSLAITLPVMLQFVSIYKVVYHYTLVVHRLEARRYILSVCQTC